MKPNNINFYKYNPPSFESLDKTVSKNSNITPKDSYESIQNRLSNSIIAPQGLGELKHTSIPKDKIPYPEKDINNIKSINAAVSVTNNKIFENRSEDFFKPPVDVRSRIEEEVRKRKQAGLPCPFADNNYHCSALSIRCGDRTQFANPENREQKNLPHDCLYRANKQGDQVLIVDSNRVVCDFCKTSLELFFHEKRENIRTANTGQKAFDILNEFKMTSKQCGLLICSTNLSNPTGLEIIREVYNRNYNTDILLIWDEFGGKLSKSEMEEVKSIVKDREIIKAVLLKPFHSQTFIEAIKKIKADHMDPSKKEAKKD